MARNTLNVAPLQDLANRIEARPLSEPLIRRGQTALHVIAVGLEQHNRRAQETVPGSQLVDRGYAQGEFQNHRYR